MWTGREHVEQAAAHRIFHEERLDLRRCHDECEQQQEQHGDHVADAVAHHRPHHGGEGFLLDAGDIRAAPNLSEAREDEVEGVGAEN